MKPINIKEIRTRQLRFAALYFSSLILLIIVFCSFWKTTPVITKINSSRKENKFTTISKDSSDKLQDVSFLVFKDSIQHVLTYQSKKIFELDSELQNKNQILQTQQSAFKKNTSKISSVTSSSLSADEIEKLKSQNHFLTWALRTQSNSTINLQSQVNSLKAQLNERTKN